MAVLNCPKCGGILKVIDYVDGEPVVWCPSCGYPFKEEK